VSQVNLRLSVVDGRLSVRACTVIQCDVQNTLRCLLWSVGGSDHHELKRFSRLSALHVTTVSPVFQCPLQSDCWHNSLSRLKALAVNLIRPSSRHVLYASSTGFNPCWLWTP